jgi:hypothetical protein
MTAGLGTIISGSQQITYSEQVLQGLGFSLNGAALINDSFSIIGTIGGAWAVNTSRMAMAKALRVPEIIDGIKTNQIWTSTRQRTSIQNAFIHWNEHGADFPELLNAKQYVESTKAFINTPPPGTLTKIRVNGDIIFYNPSTNSFVVSNAESLPRTMYKPRLGRHPYLTNLEYFNAQK